VLAVDDKKANSSQILAVQLSTERLGLVDALMAHASPARLTHRRSSIGPGQPVNDPCQKRLHLPRWHQLRRRGLLQVRGNVQYFPANNGTTCPGGSSYAGAGYCKVRQ
jgi:hypothetical protein